MFQYFLTSITTDKNPIVAVNGYETLNAGICMAIYARGETILISKEQAMKFFGLVEAG